MSDTASAEAPTRRDIRQTRSPDRKLPFHILLAPTLRARLGEIAKESGCSIAALMTAWVEFLANRYDSTDHLLLNPDEWGVEWRFNSGHLIWQVFSARNRIRHPSVEDGMGGGGEGSAPDSQEPTHDDLAALRRAAEAAVEHLIEAHEDEQG